ncbi:hypothetical protein GLOTRDRAFT_112630 [Gloeophyllum trabeum ATCC 11539]|uniref:Non-reducing end beta-L-arabinofuranosidase-like GH127 C-terminal domain-containing protein n=1 Tax=Gloeophyllum trabeum (strain ATCC 11539 / FP-39264 / Madison 617) TaxID=670483 RepID=S7R9C2_GLOTA|nr:uncharacterized protein GLOTRDRAFT_112630 [Gloeophyllum trabeum ATCC 11539]EPQ50880.1 hypothetical protein GLOTRDRAFT_112630 [Gloeophyllum trabeum ATCC 11539]
MDSEKFKEWKLDVPVLNVLGTAVERQGAGERKMYLNFVPYFAWANRGKGNTRVWFPVE